MYDTKSGEGGGVQFSFSTRRQVERVVTRTERMKRNKSKEIPAVAMPNDNIQR